MRNSWTELGARQVLIIRWLIDLPRRLGVGFDEGFNETFDYGFGRCCEVFYLLSLSHGHDSDTKSNYVARAD